MRRESRTPLPAGRQAVVGSVALGIFLATASCSGSSGSSGPASSGFQLVKISLPDGAVWQINREIEFTFTDRVDFSSVSHNTIGIKTTSGAPATGTFFFKPLDTNGDGIPDAQDEKVIVFQPTCPTESDLSDAGLRPNGVSYELLVPGTSTTSSSVVRSASGRPLDFTQRRRFTTPASLEPASVFLDSTLGPPVPVVRTAGSTSTAASYLEIGGDPNNRVYFEFDETNQRFNTDPPNFPVPLNLYSDPDSQVVVFLEFNQPVNPRESNISSNGVRLEYRDGAGLWQPIDTDVRLVSNCTQTGATVRLEPIGVLPSSPPPPAPPSIPQTRFRAVVLPGFQDLVGDPTLLSVNNFAATPTETVDFASLSPPSDGADEFFEPFDFGGEEPGSFQDTDALFETPIAKWGDGELVAAFTFAGTGGPGGDFDWLVRKDEIFLFDTTSAQIVGGPGGIPSVQLNTTNGIVDIRNLTVEEGGEIRVQGPNPMFINASGDVRIYGRIDVSGFNARNVATLNTGNQAEAGGTGAGGGGKGGNASEVLTNSTPRGGAGNGPFGQKGTGGRGGESGYSNGSKDSRRPGGGGGGRFAADECDPQMVGCVLFAEAGYDGHPNSRGAETGNSPALGGSTGTGPFTDMNPNNDFFGVKPELDFMGNLIGLTRGELPRLWAGYGGGGGGDAIPANTFPQPQWSPKSDEKGGGGGGGAGALRIRALGKIIFGPTGEILANGGRGATGENTIFLDHVGGSGGSGSGGHVMLESATQIDFTGEMGAMAMGFEAMDHDWIVAAGGATVVGPKGSQANTQVPCGISHGGRGGPGVVQLHVPDPTKAISSILAASDIVVPPTSGGQLSEVTSPTAIPMIPTFGARSRARSEWISIGGADQDPAGGEDLVQFLFGGTDPATGRINTTAGRVDELPPLLGPSTVGPPFVTVDPDGVTLVITGETALDPLINDPGPVSNDLYLRSPTLLENFILRMETVGDPLATLDYNVVSASYDDVNIVLRITVDGSAKTLAQYLIDAGLSTVQYTLIPRFFRVVTGGVAGALPDDAYVQITFQGTQDDGFGNPDTSNILVDFTGDISEFNTLAPGDLQYFRFEVEFDLDVMSQGVSVATKPVRLDFLRLPFRF